MASLPSVLPLSALSIPGTHNSHTHYHALPSVRCQIANLKTQLENGIRFLDIRIQPINKSKKDLLLVHGVFPISLTGPKYFAPLMETCYTFLTANPTETILISLKREGLGNWEDGTLSEILETHYFTPNREKWYLEDRIPYLSEVRGKLVLIRRYITHSSQASSSAQTTQSPSGLNATLWPHNTPSSLLPPPYPPLHIQDFCDIQHPSSIPIKLTHSIAHLQCASKHSSPIPGVNTDLTHPVPPGPLFLNFLSGSNFWRTGTWPGVIAGVVNRGVEEWVCSRFAGEEQEGGLVEGEVRKGATSGDGCTGVVVMDMVGVGGDWDLVKVIVGMNMGVLRRIKEVGG